MTVSGFRLGAAGRYLLALFSDAVARAEAARRQSGRRPLGSAQIAALAWLQAQPIFGAAAAAGLVAGPRMGLGAPVLAGWLHGSGRPGSRRRLMTRFALGCGTGAAVLGVDLALFATARRQLEPANVRPPSWRRGLLASTYGVIGEEVLPRLCVQTLLGAR